MPWARRTPPQPGRPARQPDPSLPLLSPAAWDPFDDAAPPATPARPPAAPPQAAAPASRRSVTEPPSGGTQPDRPSQPTRLSLPSPGWVLPSAAAVVLAVALVVIAWRSGGPAAPPGEDPSVQVAVAAAVEQAFAARDARPAVAATVYDTILPSLVVVQTERAPGAPAEVPEGDGEGEGRSGLGTGVVINDDGTVLTALHVVEGAVSVQLSFADGTRSDATVASTDPAHDIAVLTPASLPEVVVPAVLGGGLRVGDDVYAVGHPLGLVGSLSAGVVSATDRDVPISADRTLEGLIQFDAAVNPGNSGGPLLNRAGQVVGVVTALANPADVGFFVGIGFAVPIATAGGAAGGPSQ